MKTSLLIILISGFIISSCSQNNGQEPILRVRTKKSLEFPFLVDFDKALDQAEKKKKNCLFYFTGWASVDSRRLEDNILANNITQQLITSNFVYFSAYTDDKQPLPNGTGNIGEANTQLQIDKFKESVQPRFYIVSPKGEILAKQGITFTIDEFEDFLKKGIR